MLSRTHDYVLTILSSKKSESQGRTNSSCSVHMTQIHTPHLRGIPGGQDGTQHNTKTQTNNTVPLRRNKAEVSSVDPPFPMYTT